MGANAGADYWRPLRGYPLAHRLPIEDPYLAAEPTKDAAAEDTPTPFSQCGASPRPRALGHVPAFTLLTRTGAVASAQPTR